MIAYHGTTRRRAQRIAIEGFLPRKPSRRVWFAESRGYAEGRARTQAIRSHDRAVVLTVELDLPSLRAALGPKRVVHRSRIVAIDGPVPATTLRNCPIAPDQPTTPAELAAWLNDLLGVRPHKGVSPRDPGVVRLSQWVISRLADQPQGRIKPSELLGAARRWLPEALAGVSIDPDTMTVEREMPLAAAPPLEPSGPVQPLDEREERALAWLESPKPERRAQALGLLADLEDPDLAEWCAIGLGDEAVEVQVAALRILRETDGVDTGPIEPFADTDNKRLRAATLATLARCAEGDEAAEWLRRGLTDPEACVRMEAVDQLEAFDPVRDEALFELAVYDPNPEVRRRARRLAGRFEYARMRW